MQTRKAIYVNDDVVFLSGPCDKLVTRPGLTFTFAVRQRDRIRGDGICIDERFNPKFRERI